MCFIESNMFKLHNPTDFNKNDIKKYIDDGYFIKGFGVSHMDTTNNVKLTENNYHYTNNVNEINMPFQTNGAYGPGAFYFFDVIDFFKKHHEFSKNLVVGFVKLCDDSEHVISHDTISNITIHKTNKMFIAPFVIPLDKFETYELFDQHTKYKPNVCNNKINYINFICNISNELYENNYLVEAPYYEPFVKELCDSQTIIIPTVILDMILNKDIILNFIRSGNITFFSCDSFTRYCTKYFNC